MDEKGKVVVDRYGITHTNAENFIFRGIIVLPDKKDRNRRIESIKRIRHPLGRL